MIGEEWNDAQKEIAKRVGDAQKALNMSNREMNKALDFDSVKGGIMKIKGGQINLTAYRIMLLAKLNVNLNYIFGQDDQNILYESNRNDKSHCNFNETSLEKIVKIIQDMKYDEQYSSIYEGIEMILKFIPQNQ